MKRITKKSPAWTKAWLYVSLFSLVTMAAVSAEAAVFDIPAGDVEALRTALHEAQANGEADVINLAADSIYSAADTTSIGSSALPFAFYCQGDTDVTGDTPQLTINGNHAVLERNSAPGIPDMGVLLIADAYTPGVELNDLTIRNGRVQAILDPMVMIRNGIGAGLAISTSDVTVNRCTITGNESIGMVDDVPGGAIGAGIMNFAFDPARKLRVAGSTISNNIARGGDAWNPPHDARVFNLSNFFDFITGGFGTMGGGIYSYEGTVEIVDSSILDNSVIGSANGGLAFGGGLISLLDTLTIRDSTVCGNVAQGGAATGGLVSGGAAGGGLVAINGTPIGFTGLGSATIERVNFCNNTARAGEPSELSNAIGVIGYPSAGGGLILATPTTIDACSISGNSAEGGRGGGLLTVNNEAFGLPASTIATNLRIFGNSAARNPDVDDPSIPEPPTATPTTASGTPTPVPPTVTPTVTGVPPSATPDGTSVPTDTPTGILPTATPVPPTATPTSQRTPVYVPVVCPAAPASSCTTSRLGSLALRNHGNDQRDRLVWRFVRAQRAAADAFGDPTGTDGYALCVYDDSTLALNLQIEPGTADWRRQEAGFSYEHRGGNADGVTLVRLHTGNSRKPAAGAVVQAQGASLSLPAPVSGNRFFTQSSAVSVQLHLGDGRCYGNQFTPANTRRNDASGFRSRDVQG